MARIVEEEKIRLDKDDAISTRLWMDRLMADETCVFIKIRVIHPLLAQI
jgi:hypothetical protein